MLQDTYICKDRDNRGTATSLLYTTSSVATEGVETEKSRVVLHYLMVNFGCWKSKSTKYTQDINPGDLFFYSAEPTRPCANV